MKERLIVTLTTWKARIGNIPAVLDSIFNQTLPPDLVVLNLAVEEEIPEDVQAYIDGHRVEVNRVPDTKVYKKLIPTLNKYPEACVVAIDDDWLYPEGMLEEFMRIHKAHPDQPISGNRVFAFGTFFHCGCASLCKRSYYGKYLDWCDSGLMAACQSDDTFYTWCALKNGYRYIHTDNLYYENMTPYRAVEAYTSNETAPLTSWFYLCGRYGNPNKKKLKIWRRSIENQFKVWGRKISGMFKKEAQ